MKQQIKAVIVAPAVALPLLASARDTSPPQGERAPQPDGPGMGMPPQRGGPGGPPPPDASSYKGQAMRAIDEKASLLLEGGRTADAIAALRDVYTLEVPTQSPFYELKVRIIGRLARAQADAGQKSEALDTIQRLLAEVQAGTPAEAAAWLDAGEVYRELGMADEALHAFDRSIGLSKKLAATGWTPPPPAGEPRGPRARPKGTPRE